MLSIIPGPHPLNDWRTLSVTTTNVPRYYPLCPGVRLTPIENPWSKVKSLCVSFWRHPINIFFFVYFNKCSHVSQTADRNGALSKCSVPIYRQKLRPRVQWWSQDGTQAAKSRVGCLLAPPNDWEPPGEPPGGAVMRPQPRGWLLPSSGLLAQSSS